MKTKKVKISELKIDSKLTRIRHINRYIVNEYRQKYRNGVNFPLLIVEEGTNRVVSGNHRLTALRQEYPENYALEVEIRHYNNEAEVLIDFAKENTAHGMRLDTNTKRKLSEAMVDEGITPEQIAQVFGTSVKKVIKLGDGVVQVEMGNGTVKERPAKRGLEVDKPIPVEKYEEHQQKDLGKTVVQQASQLVRWLRNGFVLRSEANITVLKELKQELDKFLADKKQKIA